MARTTAHAIITEGEGACSRSVFFSAWRASRIDSQRASIWRLAGITRFSLRVIVGESAGSITVAGGGLSAVALAKAEEPGLVIESSGAARPLLMPWATEAVGDSFAAFSNCSANAGSLVRILPNS